MRLIPYYLLKKLASLNLQSSHQQISQQGYLKLYTQLKLSYPSLNYQALFDLYCLSQGTICYQLSPQLQKLLITKYQQQLPHYQELPQQEIELYLKEAQVEAEKAFAIKEIPIGAVVVYQNKIIGRGYNRSKIDNNIFAHAEIIAIGQAQAVLNNHRLTNCDLFTTIEPCVMCSGAILNSRIRRLVFGACETKTGACHSQYQVFNNKSTNHHCQVIGPIDQGKYVALLQKFLTHARNT